MKTLYQKAYFQSGQELLNGKLEPSCYATVMSESVGDTTRAMGLYAERRAAVIYAELVETDERAKRRVKAMTLAPQKMMRPRNEIDLFRPLVLLLVMFLGSTSVLLFLCGSIHGEICPGSLGKILLTASVLVAFFLTSAILVRLKLPKVSFPKVMMPFAMMVSLCSLGSASYMVKKNQQVMWNADQDPTTSVEVPAPQLGLMAQSDLLKK